jgi:hypothetical protein
VIATVKKHAAESNERARQDRQNEGLLNRERRFFDTAILHHRRHDGRRISIYLIGRGWFFHGNVSSASKFIQV